MDIFQHNEKKKNERGPFSLIKSSLIKSSCILVQRERGLNFHVKSESAHARRKVMPLDICSVYASISFR
jgi:hypothetical protein